MLCVVNIQIRVYMWNICHHHQYGLRLRCGSAEECRVLGSIPNLENQKNKRKYQSKGNCILGTAFSVHLYCYPEQFGLNFLSKLRIIKADCKVVDLALVAVTVPFYPHHHIRYQSQTPLTCWLILVMFWQVFMPEHERQSSFTILCLMDLFAPEVGFQAQCPYQNRNLVSGLTVGWEWRADLSERQHKIHFEQWSPLGSLRLCYWAVEYLPK